MKKVELGDIIGLAAYEKVREPWRQRIIAVKQKRRIALGDKVSLVFENRDTVIFPIQEMIRAEKITDLDKIREEIDVYNELIPAAGELSATLFIEIADQSRIREELPKFLGIDRAVRLRVIDQTIQARFEEGRSKEDKISAVQYVKFPFSQRAITAFADSGKAEVIVDHPNYTASTVIGAGTRQSLLEDLSS